MQSTLRNGEPDDLSPFDSGFCIMACTLMQQSVAQGEEGALIADIIHWQLIFTHRTICIQRFADPGRYTHHSALVPSCRSPRRISYFKKLLERSEAT
ncbi:hypothetical protein EDD22DRAFT_966417 [Suillus occidentalis]|nr:hypothetical protein EDD22DRAFT_966417 [Suillus occidentalis]